MTRRKQQPGHRSRLVALALVAGTCVIASSCSRTPRQKEARYLEAGKRQLEKKDYARAIIYFRNAAKAMPTDAEPPYQMALAYIARRDWQYAYASLNKAVQLNPNHQS